ncbi:MAG: endonuclease/exonuclease/phosphatase family protein [Bacteroidales bacterium]|nr:endonuclease/exonuclease/phosphatase family protein [Bacteroidales bacterium]
MYELQKLTLMHPFFAKAINYSNGSYGEGILTRHEVLFESFPLPTPEGGEGRSLAMAHYTLGNGNRISFATTHLCHEFDENRLAQTKEIIKILDKIQNPLILCGDFNFTPKNKSYHILAERFIDLAQIAGNEQSTFSSHDPQSRIDFIWLSKNIKYNIINISTLDFDYSDHKPLLAKIKIFFSKN